MVLAVRDVPDAAKQKTVQLNRKKAISNIRDSFLKSMDRFLFFCNYGVKKQTGSKIVFQKTFDFTISCVIMSQMKNFSNLEVFN